MRCQGERVKTVAFGADSGHGLGGMTAGNSMGDEDHRGGAGSHVQLRTGLNAVRGPDGALVLVAPGGVAGCDVETHEEPLHPALVAGTSIAALLETAAAHEPPVTPFEVLEFLRRLDDAGLLVRDDTAPGRSSRRLGQRLLRATHLVLPGTAFVPRALGRLLPLHALWWVGSVGALAAVAGLAAALLAGRATLALGPLWLREGDLGALGEVALLYSVACAVLSARGFARALTAAAAGVAEPRAALQLTGPVLHLELERAARRTVPMPARRTLALTGLGTIALSAGAATLLWLAGAGDIFQRIAAVAWVLLLFDTAPYLKSDTATLLGLLARLPQLGRRSASYVFRRMFLNLLRGAAAGSRESTYVAVGSYWVLHACLGVGLFGKAVLPSALARLHDVARSHQTLAGGTLPLLEFAVIGAATALAALLLVGFCGGLLGGVIGLVAQVARMLGWVDRPVLGRRRAAAEDEQAAFVEAALGIPFLAAAGADVLRALAQRLEACTRPPSAVVFRQGDPGERFYFVRSGAAQVILEEESGLHHTVAVLGVGEFFGEVALLERVPRTATVKAVPVARQALELLSIEGPAFLQLVGALGGSSHAVTEQLRNAACLRNHPLVAHLGTTALRTLLAAVTVEKIETGATIVRQGDAARDLYIIRDGACSVRVIDAVAGDREVGRLGLGAWFGEVALLHDGRRTATVRAETATSVLRLPASAVSAVLLADVKTALTLQRFAAERRRGLAGGT
ncbi:MAG: cyclic nucleotide-binding domain-containing protein [Myxococcales bacterium]|nr:cyclic nucleotide-binding domain-containing protein [Myxococcales bacterium]